MATLKSDGVNQIDLRELLEAGCHFGHQARRWNPKMESYIYSRRDGVHILDLAITANKLSESMDFVREFVKSGKEIIFVGTKRQASDIIKEEATKIGAPYVSERWLGGTLTNWDQLFERIKHLNKLKEDREKGEHKRFTKRERVMIDKEIVKLERFFGGLAHLKQRPEALFVVDITREDTAIKEAAHLEMPVVAMVDTNANPTGVQYVIPINDDAVRSIKLVVTKIAQAYVEGKELARSSTKPEVGDEKKAEKK
jgi:small subunit ribosomal protein S2